MYCALFRIILERPSNIASTRTCSPKTLVPFYSLHTKIKKTNKGVWDILVHTANIRQLVFHQTTHQHTNRLGSHRRS